MSSFAKARVEAGGAGQIEEDELTLQQKNHNTNTTKFSPRLYRTPKIDSFQNFNLIWPKTIFLEKTAAAIRGRTWG